MILFYKSYYYVYDFFIFEKTDLHFKHLGNMLNEGEFT